MEDWQQCQRLTKLDCSQQTRACLEFMVNSELVIIKMGSYVIIAACRFLTHRLLHLGANC